MERLQSLRGMRDLLPGETPRWRLVEETVRELFDSWAYEEIRLPLLEPTTLFARAAGATSDIVEKQMYSFGDRDGESITLRPEGTAGCVRALIENGLIRQPQRLWYSGAMFRHERPQKGRYREFTQFGAEALGYAGPDVDVELMQMMAALWQRLGIAEHVQLELNSIGDAADRVRYRQVLVDYFTAHRAGLDEDSRRRLEHNPLRILDSKEPGTQAIVTDAPRMGEFLGEPARQHFARLQELLAGLNIECVLNDRLVRGLDYYNRTVFEWTTRRLGAQGTICAGGRYDTLVEMLGGPPTPAAGFGIGLDRVVLLFDEIHQTPARAPVDVYCIIGENADQAAAMRICQSLRVALPALRLRVNQGGGKLKAQFRRADASGAAAAVVLAEDEMASGTVTLKWLRVDAPQERLGLDAAVARLAVSASHVRRD